MTHVPPIQEMIQNGLVLGDQLLAAQNGSLAILGSGQRWRRLSWRLSWWPGRLKSGAEHIATWVVGDGKLR